MNNLPGTSAGASASVSESRRTVALLNSTMR